MIIYELRWGLVHSIAQTFGMSVVIWAALYLAITRALDSQSSVYHRYDWVLIPVTATTCFVPSGAVSAFCQIIVSLYIIATTRPIEPLHKAGWISLAATVPIYITKKIMTFSGQYIVLFDAFFVSLVTGTQQTENLVAMPTGQGSLLIAPGCSSLANVSSAMLCWVLFTQSRNIQWTYKNLYWCAAACASVIAINIARISAIGFFPDYYYLLHDGLGAILANWLSSIVAIWVCHLGTRDAK